MLLVAKIDHAKIVSMKPISKTAFYCCGVRMQDAERQKPVCGDNYAKVFMNACMRAYGRLLDRFSLYEISFVWTSADNFEQVIGGVDGTRTRDPRRDRPVF